MIECKTEPPLITVQSHILRGMRMGIVVVIAFCIYYSAGFCDDLPVDLSLLVTSATLSGDDVIIRLTIVNVGKKSVRIAIPRYIEEVYSNSQGWSLFASSTGEAVDLSYKTGPISESIATRVLGKNEKLKHTLSFKRKGLTIHEKYTFLNIREKYTLRYEYKSFGVRGQSSQFVIVKEK